MPELKIEAAPGSPIMTMTRDFDASPELVFRCMTEPGLIEQWWGPCIYTTKVESLEPRHGGVWRFINIGEDGSEHAFNGVFHGEQSIEAGLTQTWEYEGVPGHPCLQLMRFEVVDGKTVMHATAVYDAVESRDGHINAGMEYGMRESYERLDELKAKGD